MAKKRVKETSSEGEYNEQNPAFSMIADYDGNEEGLFNIDVDEFAAILPLRNMVLFPSVVLPVSVGRQSSLQLVNDAVSQGKNIAVFCQREPNTEFPIQKDLFQIGTLAKVVRVFEMPDHGTTIVLQGLQRIRLTEVVSSTPYLTGRIEAFPEVIPPAKDKEFDAIIDTCRDMTIKYIKSSDSMQPDAAFALKNISNGMFLVNFICSNIPFAIKDKVRLLKEKSIIERALRLLSILNKELQLAELKMSIQKRTHEDLDKQQKEYFLQQQIKNIQDELGGSVQEQEIEEMRQKAEKKLWNDETRQIFEKELVKLERTNSQTPDYNIQLTYLQTLLNLPWNEYTQDNLDMKNAQKALDKEHYGLEKVKERILEHLAVMKLRGDFKSPIICLYGPPGVGKTSLGQSIAHALKRKYVRISLGGLHDESEIRGHRKTYIGAMPGRIIKGITKAGSSNPVFILDEIDKISQMTHQGDPAAALLEVLDPEQNNAFHDNFLDIDYDLSKVMFIATANNLNTIPSPLLDRMELIEVSGYITEEKKEIAKRHLIPKEIEANGIPKKAISISSKAIETIIEDYTRESGVRDLEKKIGKICRRMAYKYASEGDFGKKTIQPADLKELLGTKPYSRDKYQGNDYAGVVTGLAWTAVGGEILFVETSLSEGKGVLTTTGNLGDVMKESAVIAYQYIKAHPELIGLKTEDITNKDIHLHVPEGAIPKDGPSAGITMVSSMASAFKGKSVKHGIAMTGEMTLRGKVLPVGGIKEKILAAKRAGINTIILSAENEKEIKDIKEVYIEGLTFHYVKTMEDVLKFIF